MIAQSQGIVDEKTNRRSIQSSNIRVACGRPNDRNRKGSISGGKITSGLRPSPEYNTGSGFSSCETSLGGSREEIGSTRRVRTRNSGIAKIPRLSSKEMGKGRRGPMKTLVTANQKGGVGKTATLVHLAFDFAERGLKVAVIDLDTQANASFTLKTYRSGVTASSMFSNESIVSQISDENINMMLIESDAGLADLEKMALPDAARNFQKAIAELDAKGFDVCLMDTAPSLGVAMAAALLSADYVLSPIELEAYSIQGIHQMVTTIVNIRKVNKKLKFIGMVPSKVDSRNPRHGRHLNELNTAYPSMMVPLSVGLRSSIPDALASCSPVWKIKKTAARVAAKEVRALAAYVFTQMEITNDVR